MIYFFDFFHGKIRVCACAGRLRLRFLRQNKEYARALGGSGFGSAKPPNARGKKRAPAPIADTAPAVVELVGTLEEQGATVSANNVQIAYSETGRRGLFATSHIAKGADLVSIPAPLALEEFTRRRPGRPFLLQNESFSLFGLRGGL